MPGLRRESQDFGRGIASCDDEAGGRGGGDDAGPDRACGEQHRLDVGLVIERAGETECRRCGFGDKGFGGWDVDAVRHDVDGVASADPAQPARIRLANAHGGGVAAHGAAGVARRHGDLAQAAVSLAQIAVGQEAAPEFQRIAVDHVDDGARQVRAIEPQCLGAGPQQGAIGTVIAQHAVDGGAQDGLIEAPRIGDTAGGQA